MDGQLTPAETTASPPHGSVYAHGCALFRKFVFFLLFVCLLGVGLWWVAREQSGYFIHKHLVQLLEDLYEKQGITTRLGSVDFVEGQGVVLEDDPDLLAELLLDGVEAWKDALTEGALELRFLGD